jgi:hypothetical protein
MVLLAVYVGEVNADMITRVAELLVVGWEVAVVVAGGEGLCR